MKEMKKQHLEKRGNRWYFQVRVPKDLIPSYPGKIIRRSLGTSDLKEACRLRDIAMGDLQREFAVKRRTNQGDYDSLTLEQAEVIAAYTLHEYLSEDEEERARGNPTTIATMETGHEEMLSRCSEALFLRSVEPVEGLIKGHSEFHGYTLKPGSDSWNRLGYALLKACLRGAETCLKRLNGYLIDTPPPPTAPLPNPETATPNREGILLTVLLEKWLLENAVRPRTRQEHYTAIHRFVEMAGDLPVDSITKANIRAFKEGLTLLPPNASKRYPGLTTREVLKKLEGPEGEGIKRLDPITINKDLNILFKLLKWAHNEGFIDSLGWTNPADGMRVKPRQRRQDGKHPYSVDDLGRIFQSPVFSKGERSLGGKGEAQYWLPLLALFTGARLNELGQLMISDIKTQAGIQYIDINEDGDNKSLKNPASARLVPVHSHLHRLGFPDYIEQLRTTGEVRVFPLVNAAPGRQKTSSFSQWWGRYTRGKFVGLIHPKKSFHSFRHTFIDSARMNRVPDSTLKVLIGHTGGSVTEDYGHGEGTMIELLAKEMERIEYPGLDLSHLH
jgi:integrase